MSADSDEYYQYKNIVADAETGELDNKIVNFESIMDKYRRETGDTNPITPREPAYETSIYKRFRP